MTDSISNDLAVPKKSQFRIVHMMYAMAVFAVAVSVFQIGGLFVGVLICGFWGLLIALGGTGFSVGQQISFLFIGLLFLIVTLTVMVQPGDEPVRSITISRLYRIKTALDQYHLRYNSYPPPVTYNSAGEPMHSWRVLILPYLDEQNLFNRYRLDEPWDGPNNRKLIAKAPEPYLKRKLDGSPLEKSRTNIVAVTGENTFWSLAKKQVTATSLLLAELNESTIPWSKPNDPSVDQFLSNINTEYSYFGLNDRSVLLSNSLIKKIPNRNFDAKLWHKLINTNQEITDDELDSLVSEKNQSSIHPFIFTFFKCVLFFLVVFPLPWFLVIPELDE